MRSKLTVALLLLLVLIVAPVLAQEPQDLDGWRAAKWGMSETDVLGAFGGEAVRLNQPERFHGPTVATIAIPKYEIQSTECRVLFGFNAAGALSLVQIAPLDNVTPGVWHEGLFTSLDNLLTEKYGEPTSTKDERVVRSRVWRLPRTVISLNYLFAVFGILKGIDLLTLTYQATPKEAYKP
jgi:hypothetical protein